MDVEFLDSGFKEAVEEYRKNFTNPCTPEETLKNANWNVVEIQILLQQVQLLKQVYEAELSQLNPAVVRPQDLRVVKHLSEAWLVMQKATFRTYSRRREQQPPMSWC